MTDIAGIAVAVDVGRELVFGDVAVAGADVFVLEGLKLLCCAEFVCHFGAGVGLMMEFGEEWLEEEAIWV